MRCGSTLMAHGYWWLSVNIRVSSVKKMRKSFTILIPIILLLAGCTSNNVSQSNSNPGFDLTRLNPDLIRQAAELKAQQVYQEAVDKKMDLSKGPCLSNDLYGNPQVPSTMWVLDIAHDPRQAVDDLPENQCSAFLQGKAMHFIEMNSQGEVMREK